MCPSVDEMEDLDMEKMQGKWYVMKKVKTSISCLTDYISRLPEPGSYNYTERQQLFDQVFMNEAVIKTRDGQRKIDYPLLFPDSSFKVIDTDYDTYAVIYKCQPLIASRRWSVSVLSRTLEMTRDTVDKLERQFIDATKVDTKNYMNHIDHTNCVDDDQALFTIGVGPGLSITPGGQAIDSIADGFRGLAGDWGGSEDTDASEEDIEFF